jgi:hypothetical protein
MFFIIFRKGLRMKNNIMGLLFCFFFSVTILGSEHKPLSYSHIELPKTLFVKAPATLLLGGAALYGTHKLIDQYAKLQDGRLLLTLVALNGVLGYSIYCIVNA